MAALPARRGARSRALWVVRAVPAALTAALLLVATGPTAGASCAGAVGPAGSSPTAQGPAFVGTVTATENGDRTATVHVEEVWRGGALPAEVTVRGSPVDTAGVTDVDRHYAVGARYLFQPFGSVSPFDDNSCSGTAPFTAEIAAHRPADARVVAAPVTAATGPSVAFAVVAGVAAAVLLAAAAVGIARRRLR